MNWRGYRRKYCERKTGSSSAAEGHQLRFDALQARGGAKRSEHFGQQSLRDGGGHGMRRSEEAADEALVILEHVESVTARLAVVDGGVTAQGARIDEPADQIDGRTVIPVKLLAPMPSSSWKRISRDREWSWRRSTICIERPKAL